MRENNDNQKLEIARKRKLARQLDAAGWGLFFIWVGIAVLADLGWGAGFIGVGVIIIGGMLVRSYLFGSTGSGKYRACC